MPKRFYILFVARGEDGQLRKIPIPVHYLYVLAVGALVGVLGLTGLASSYVRMLLKVSSYNELRAEREDLKHRYNNLEEVAKERDIQVASLGSLARGWKPASAADHFRFFDRLNPRCHDTAGTTVQQPPDNAVILLGYTHKRGHTQVAGSPAHLASKSDVDRAVLEVYHDGMMSGSLGDAYNLSSACTTDQHHQSQFA